jgi:hypothetical protein
MNGPIEITNCPPEYRSLAVVLCAALHQAAHGKGKERHAKPGEAFEDQKICEITRRVGLGYPLGQAIKKAEEAPGLKPSGGVRELLGAINYLAAGVIIMEEEGVNDDQPQGRPCEKTLFPSDQEWEEIAEDKCFPGRSQPYRRAAEGTTLADIVKSKRG